MQNKKILILGAGESGVGAAILAQQKGYQVLVSEARTISPKYRQQLETHHIDMEEGGHTRAYRFDPDEVIKSPGIPENVEVVKTFRKLNIPIISDIEFAARYTSAKMVCITGSNGKTTTTSLIYHILSEAGYSVGLAGNIGRSFAMQVAEGQKDWYVLELSSFQLDDMYDFKAHIGVLLNITPDHLDRYDFEMQRYVDAKLRILQNMTPNDTFIYWKGDAIIEREVQERTIVAECLPFSDVIEDGVMGYAEEDIVKVTYPEALEIPLSSLKIEGIHNQRNVLAAILATLSAGVEVEKICAALQTFTGVEHRLEKVANVNGVSYINDSKATNVDACYWALKSMQNPTVLIIGGKDKGNDYTPLLALVKKRCRGLVFLGADNTLLEKVFAPLGLPMVSTSSMQACVSACSEMALSGDTVLLSPCCASFDLFKNMEDRGEQFKDCVHQLQENHKIE